MHLPIASFEKGIGTNHDEGERERKSGGRERERDRNLITMMKFLSVKKKRKIERHMLEKYIGRAAEIGTKMKEKRNVKKRGRDRERGLDRARERER